MGTEQKEMILGYKFSPTEEDLLYYLGKKVSGEASVLPIDAFIDCDIYGDNREPWKLFDKSSNQILYVFTRLIKKSKSKIQRVAGSGSWNGRTESKEIKGGLGYMKYFVFKVKNDPRNTKNGYWVMHEFSLRDDDSYVLCRIQNRIPILNPDDEDPILESSASQETDSCVENSKKRRLNLRQDDQQSKKMRTGSGSSSSMGCTEEEQLAVAQEESVAYQFQEESTPLDDGHELSWLWF